MAYIRDRFTAELHSAVRVLDGSADDFGPLMEMVGDDVRLVLIGEASHGTHEFYRMRAQITQKLIRERDFTAVAVEADWPDAYRVNRYARGFQDDETAADALGGFRRFPQWMWRNADELDFVGWLREFNDDERSPRGPKIGFYGMDLYSLYGSIEAVLKYLEKVDPDAARRARYRYACFEHFGEDPQAYGYAAGFDIDRSCENAVIQQLQELRARAADYAHRDGRLAEDEYFFADQNARLIKNAERYYRTMFAGRISSWNLRDTHMTETLAALMEYLDEHVGGRTKIVVWAHNSHLGDARATEMGDAGEVNVGSLARQRWGRDVVNIGFSTYSGTVTAASDWDGHAERKIVRPGMSGSYEELFHAVAERGAPNFFLNLRDARSEARRELNEPRLQRAIGVIYLPQTERVSHYFNARLADQFDAMIHLDETRAVEPLETQAPVEELAETETYPSGV
jgi:erythromycin esterase-like protein